MSLSCTSSVISRACRVVNQAHLQIGVYLGELKLDIASSQEELFMLCARGGDVMLTRFPEKIGKINKICEASDTYLKQQRQ